MYFWYPWNQIVKKFVKLLLKIPNIQKIENDYLNYSITWVFFSQSNPPFPFPRPRGRSFITFHDSTLLLKPGCNQIMFIRAVDLIKHIYWVDFRWFNKIVKNKKLLKWLFSHDSALVYRMTNNTKLDILKTCVLPVPNGGSDFFLI